MALDLVKENEIPEHRKRNRCLTNGSLRSGGNQVQHNEETPKERCKIKMGTISLHNIIQCYNNNACICMRIFPNLIDKHN